MIKPPKVAVIIPCYNHGHYIDEAIKSILNQTFVDYEIIVIDDGSTEPATKEKLKNLDYPKTHIYFQENRGPVQTRNIAISKTKAEYILPLDADDYFDHTFLEKAVKILDTRPEIGAVNCFVKAFGRENYVSTPKSGGIENFLLRNNASNCLLYRKLCWEQAGGYNINMKNGSEDWDFWLSVTEKGWLIYVIPEVLFYYRRHMHSRDDVAYNEYHHENMRNLVSNHLEFYKTNILDYVYGKELELMNLRTKKNKELDKLTKSSEYRIGEMLLWPYKILKRLIGRIFSIIF
jgi:glycosyltransferase involved in cell wall biosynthesis